MEEVIKVQQLHKRYGSVTAVEDVSFSVEKGTVFALVGPNGAGKTTTVECIEGICRPDGGRIELFGRELRGYRSEMFSRIGVQLQENGLYASIKPQEAIRLFAAMHEEPLDGQKLLQQFGLEKRADAYYQTLSGGEKRKLLAALALIGNPDVIILDEPTSGVDPHSRREFWAVIRSFQRNGLTVLLTTHDMQEAEDQADTVCIVDNGRVVAMGDPKRLIAEYELGTRITVSLPNGEGGEDLFADCTGITRVERHTNELMIYGQGEPFTTAVTARLQSHGWTNYAIRPATLEDLFLIVTGREYRSETHALD